MVSKNEKMLHSELLIDGTTCSVMTRPARHIDTRTKVKKMTQMTSHNAALGSVLAGLSLQQQQQ
jgi:hypothetical protein